MHRITSGWVLLLAGLWPLAGVAAGAPQQLEVTATDPAAAVDLPHNANLYARVHYQSDQPVRVQAAGMRDGAEVPGTTNPSPVWEAGEGEVLAWIGFREPTSIDHLRVTLYDAQWQPLRHVDVPMAISWHAGAPAHQRAAWVKPLSDEQQGRVGTGMQAASSGAGALIMGGLVMMSLPVYVLMQVLVLLLLKGGWRRWAMPPLVVMLGAAVVSVFALFAGSNLWPIWMILLAPLALLYLIVLALLYALARRRGATA